MDFALDRADREFLEEFRAYLDSLVSEGFYSNPGLVGPDHAMGEEEMAERKRFIERLGQDGWLGISWPVEYGGRGMAGIRQWLMLDELSRRQMPSMLLGVLMIGPTILRIGSGEHKAEYLPKLLSGEYEFCLGYSEPGAGTDLANLQTRAVREGDEYVINGQKIYTTAAQYATHVWLSVRTGAPDSRHAGVTVIVVPIDTPGITVRPLITGADYRTNEVFYDDVRVPVANRVGEENGGWKVISMALQFERTPTANRLVREFGEVLHWATTDGPDGTRPADNPLVRARIGRLSAHADVARLFSLRIAGMVANGEVPLAEGSMAKVWNTDYGQELTGAALAMMGPEGVIGLGEPETPLDGVMELTYRESTVFRFAAGTNEVQRDIIAQRGLGLPRNRR
ncbi:acyl-CoA dehydrogenase family protein [Microbacterium sp. A82]|uniref:acyl-CoA dehydrogenase family protein n=1 Tax=Microbacterium sp. A82 TaxID=3450452 RepID=UPI003F2A9E9F